MHLEGEQIAARETVVQKHAEVEARRRVVVVVLERVRGSSGALLKVETSHFVSVHVNLQSSFVVHLSLEQSVDGQRTPVEEDAGVGRHDVERKEILGERASDPARVIERQIEPSGRDGTHPVVKTPLGRRLVHHKERGEQHIPLALRVEASGGDQEVLVGDVVHGGGVPGS